MHSRTTWAKVIPALLVVLVMVFMAVSALGSENFNGKGVPACSPVVVAGTETVNLSTDEAKLIEAINGSRKQAGVPELVPNLMLTEMARVKAEDMASRRQLSYQSPAYGTMEDMLRQAGVKYQEVKVNLAKVGSPGSAHKYFMRYSSTKTYILNPAFDQLGIGCQADGHGNYYVVEVFIDSLKDDSNTPSAGGNSQGSNGTGAQPNPAPKPDTGYTADEQQMLQLVNTERAKQGIKPLQMDSSLLKLARQKARDMIDNNYFDHTSPTYGSPFEMMRNAGISYSYAGENLAKAATVNGAHTALMNSSGHRANILNENYDRVGIGIIGSGGYKYVVQMFTGGQSGGSSVPAPRPKPAPAPEPAPSPNLAPAPGPAPSPSPTSGADQNFGTNILTADELKMFRLVNRERAANGVTPLKINENLVKLARMKAQDMIKYNYFDHNSPTYGSPFEMMQKYGVSYSYAGENLAGAPTVDSAHTNLMNSEGHRRNILNPNFTEVGIGVVDGGPYGKMLVQMFIKP
ncbi:CAP domain-containing protein [Desulfotruncus alcoholivorax]|uniref:CAP domain-containing protein n=1 Tax=Desulfotruncus alcoholivorax TaxID=265477 RepID=UPI0004254B3B|nr:CAP domain-containing protein [Desulfotruncus alcoholivorax]